MNGRAAARFALPLQNGANRDGSPTSQAPSASGPALQHYFPGLKPWAQGDGHFVAGIERALQRVASDALQAELKTCTHFLFHQPKQSYGGEPPRPKKNTRVREEHLTR